MISGVEKLDVTNPDVQRFIIEACASSKIPNKEHEHNYTKENFLRQFAENRFDIGFFLVRHEGRPLAFFGLSNHEQNWIVASRLIHLENVRHNFLWGAGGLYILPFLDQAYSNKYAGVFFCMNGTKTIATALFRRLRTKQQNNQRHPLDSYTLLPYTVLYRGVEQTVLYKAFDASAGVPPLRKHKDIEWNLYQEKV